MAVTSEEEPDVEQEPEYSTKVAFFGSVAVDIRKVVSGEMQPETLRDVVDDWIVIVDAVILVIFPAKVTLP